MGVIGETCYPAEVPTAENTGYDQALYSYPIAGQTPVPPNQNVILVQPGSQPQKALPSVWNTGLLSCCDDIASCCFGLFLAPCHACNVATRMNECCCVGFLNIPAMRTKYRMKYNIRGSICDDICLSTFCQQCVICQLDRELRLRAE